MKHLFAISIVAFFVFDTAFAQQNPDPAEIASALREQRAERTRTITEIETLKRDNQTLRRRVTGLGTRISTALSRCDSMIQSSENDRDSRSRQSACRVAVNNEVTGLRAEQQRIKDQIRHNLTPQNREKKCNTRWYWS